ncbi:unnamed protein product [Dicrocoelium dendriticum]|nr:unnamed protein product [Dicrocoelium dendriticum]
MAPQKHQRLSQQGTLNLQTASDLSRTLGDAYKYSQSYKKRSKFDIMHPSVQRIRVNSQNYRTLTFTIIIRCCYVQQKVLLVRFYSRFMGKMFCLGSSLQKLEEEGILQESLPV